MKYTIEGFNQIEVIKLGNLDIVDLVILRWIVDFEPKMTKKEIDNEIYFWVNYHSLLEALPILNIKKLALYRRLEKMCDADMKMVVPEQQYVSAYERIYRDVYLKIYDANKEIFKTISEITE